jgi:hypothetical protein
MPELIALKVSRSYTLQQDYISGQWGKRKKGKIERKTSLRKSSVKQ